MFQTILGILDNDLQTPRPPSKRAVSKIFFSIPFRRFKDGKKNLRKKKIEKNADIFSKNLVTKVYC